MQTTFWKKSESDDIFKNQNSEHLTIEEKARTLIRRSAGVTVFAVGQVRQFHMAHKLAFLTRKRSKKSQIF